MNLSPSTSYSAHRLPVPLPHASLGGEKAHRIIETCTIEPWPAMRRCSAGSYLPQSTCWEPC